MPRLRYIAGRLLLVFHELGSERALGRELIVSPTEEPDVRDARAASTSEFLRVIEFQEPALGTTAAGLARERALTTVAHPDRALHVSRDMSGIRRLRARTPARAACRGELVAFELGNQRVQRPLKDGCRISGRDLVAQEFCGTAQLVVGALTHRELNRESSRCQRRDLGSCFVRCNTPRGVFLV